MVTVGLLCDTDKGWQTFSKKGQILDILDFADIVPFQQLNSAACSAKAAIISVKHMGVDVPIKFC